MSERRSSRPLRFGGPSEAGLEPSGAARSLLFVCALDERKVANALDSCADEVILDLEDTVVGARKAEARVAALDVIAQCPEDRRVSVRVNAVGTSWCHEDLLAFAASARRPARVILARVDAPADVHLAARLLDGADLMTDEQPPLLLAVLVETAAAVVGLREIAASSSRVGSLMFGPGDYSASVGAPTLDIGSVDEGGGEGYWPRPWIVAVARAYGLEAVDGAYGRLRDRAGFLRDAKRGRALGFDGKLCIHPDQAELANEVFTPDEAEYRRAVEIIAAHEAAEMQGVGVLRVGDAMIDGVSVALAERTVARRLAAERRSPIGAQEGRED